jgi:hypothetical protein
MCSPRRPFPTGTAHRQPDLRGHEARSACMCSPRRPFPTGTAHRRSACSRDYRGDSQSQVQARRLSQRRGVVPAAARRVGLPSASLAAIGRLAGPKSEICGLKARMMRTFARLQEITIPFRGLRRQTHPPSHPPYAGDETGARTSNTRTRNAAARGATEPLPRTSRRPCAFSNVPRGSRICGHTFGFTQWSWIHHASRSHCYDFRTLRTLLL